jgi:hypothetical protein
VKRLVSLLLCLAFLAVGALLIRTIRLTAPRASSRVTFLARGLGHTLFLTPSEAVLVLTTRDSAAKRPFFCVTCRMKRSSLPVGHDDLQGIAREFDVRTYFEVLDLADT